MSAKDEIKLSLDSSIGSNGANTGANAVTNTNLMNFSQVHSQAPQLIQNQPPLNGPESGSGLLNI